MESKKIKSIIKDALFNQALTWWGLKTKCSVRLEMWQTGAGVEMCPLPMEKHSEDNLGN